MGVEREIKRDETMWNCRKTDKKEREKAREIDVKSVNEQGMCLRERKRCLRRKNVNWWK